MLKLFAQNEELYESLKGNNNILDSQINRILLVEEEQEIKVEIDFLLHNVSENKKVRIVFNHIKEFSFYYNSQYIFYNVERFKLLLLENGYYYLSLDPYDESMQVSSKDQDIIIARNIIGFEMPA